MVVKLKNNAATYIPALVDTTATSVTVATNTGSVFPTLAAGDYFYATLSSVADDYEIVRVTVQNIQSVIDDLSFLLL